MSREFKSAVGVVLLVATLIAYALSGCGSGPTPVPDPPPGPAPSGPFDGKIFDCTGFDSSSGAPLVQTCGDVENTGGCMVAYLEQGQPAALLICAARDVESDAFVRIAKGTAGPELTARAHRLRAWLASTNATLRSAP